MKNRDLISSVKGIIMAMAIGAAGISAPLSTTVEIAAASETSACSIETDSAKLSYVGSRMLDSSIPSGDNVGKEYVLVLYAYENKTLDAKQPQQDFWPRVYQNGVELSELSSRSVNGTEDSELLDSYFKTVIKGGVLEFGKAYELQGDGPLTVILSQNGLATVDPVSFDVNIGDEAPADGTVSETSGEAAENDTANNSAYSIETDSAKLSFVGSRMLDSSVPSGDNVGKEYVLMIFDYENKTMDAKQPQRDFWPRVYQNGVELSDLSSRSVNGTEDSDLLDAFFKTVIKGGVLEFGKAYELQGDGPLTVIMSQNGMATVEPVSFDVNIGEEVSAGSDQPAEQAEAADSAVTEEANTSSTPVEETAAEATTEPEKKSKWEVKYFLDDFGDPMMDDPYVSELQMNVGTFSNTATAGSKVYANTIVEDHLVSLFLYEYGRNPVVNASSYNNDEYDVKYKDEDGNVIECFGISYPQCDRIWIVNDTGVTNAKDHTDKFTLDDSSKILALFNKDQVLSVSVKDRNGLSSYTFKMDTTGFKDAFAQAFPEQSAKASSYTDAETVMKVQQALNEAGFDCGSPDGKAGQKTYAALNAYQEANGLPVENLITDELLSAMGLN